MTNAPDVIFEGGYLPVNAELIERRLDEIWSQGSDDSGGERLVKICLSNILIISDACSRLDAENLAQQIALQHPSRVMLVVIDPSLKTYSSFVRTACEYNPEIGALICWEIIELLSDDQRASGMAGAVRSLLKDSVPVLTIDFRAYQSTPEFDSDLREMSDYYIVQAEVVAVGTDANRLIPLSWYRTLSMRETLGNAFGLVLQKCREARLDRITVFYDPSTARLDPLLAGWLVYRLADNGQFDTGDAGVCFNHSGNPVTLHWQTHGPECAAMELRFLGGSSLLVSGERTRHGGMCAVRVMLDGKDVARQTESTGLLAYLLVAANGGGKEFDEYAAVQRVMTMLLIP